MNFAQVRQIKGQKDEKNYPKKLDIFGVLKEIGGTYFNTNQTPCSKCKITDDMNEQHSVTILKTIPATNLLNTRQAFRIYSFDGNHQGTPYVGYSGFWVDNPQRHESSPQQPPQASQQAAQRPSTPQNVPEHTARKEALGMAINLAIAGKIEISEIYVKTHEFEDYILHNRQPYEKAGVNSNPTTMDNEPWPPEDP